MFICLCLLVNSCNSLFNLVVIHNIILALLRVVGRGEDKELGRESVEHWRYCRESVTTTGEVDIFLSQRQQKLLHIYPIRRSDVSFAVIKDKKAVDEILLDIFKYFLLAMADDATCTAIRSNVVLETRMYPSDIHPLVFVRCDNQSSASAFQALPKNGAQDRCLACAWLAYKHELEDLTRFFRLRLGFLRYHVLRVHFLVL